MLANTNLELADVVGEIPSVQGSDLKNNAATTRVVVCLLIEPYVKFYFSAVRFIAASLAATAIFSMNACSFRRRGSLRQRLRPNATSASERR